MKVFVLAVLFAVTFATSLTCAEKPNVIFILTDDLGWGDLGCYGHPHIKTPNLDQLAKRGTLFTQFYVNGSVCSPSRVAFMTGQFPARHRIHGHLASHAQNEARGMPNWLDPQATLITRMLQGAGYATAHYGKWHLGRGEGAPDPGAYGIDDHRTVSTNGPGFEEQVDDDSVVTAVDFLPTLCHLAGVDLPKSYAGDGEDITDILTAKSRQRVKPIMWEWRFRVAGYPIHHSPILSIREGNWKLLMNPDRSRVELYDVAKDHLELNNLAGQHPDVVKQLSGRIADWQATLPKGPIDPTAGKENYHWPRSAN